MAEPFLFKVCGRTSGKIWGSHFIEKFARVKDEY
jgi:hypothetical protein